MVGNGSNSALAVTRAKKFERERSVVERAVAYLCEQGVKPSFYAVAKASGVSRSTLYRRPELRELVEEARLAPLSTKSDPLLMQDLQDQVDTLTKENQALREALFLLLLSTCRGDFAEQHLWIEYDAVPGRAA